MPVVTSQISKMIGRLEVGKLGRGPQIMYVLNVFICQMDPQVKWNFSGGKLYFRFLMFQNGSKNQYLGFQRFSRKSEKVKFFTYHVTRLHIAKISHFKNMLELSQYGPGLFSIDANDDWPS